MATSAATTIWAFNASFGNPHIQAYDLATGIAVADFEAPNKDALRGRANGRGIAVVGTAIYYTLADTPNVYKTDAVTHADLGIAFTTALTPGINSLAWDGASFWMVASQPPALPADDNVYQYSPFGQLLKTLVLARPVNTNLARDGIEVTPTGIVANRGSVPYDIYDFNGTLQRPFFITATFRATGIAFDGTNYFVSDVIQGRIAVFDGAGNFTNFVNLSGAAIPFGIVDLAVSTVPAVPRTASTSSDFNGDGHLDVLWQDPATGLAQVWLLGGTGVSFIGAANLTASNPWHIVGVGDFNGDGRPDVVWQDPVSGATQVWFLGGTQGNVVTGAVTLNGPNTWRIVSIADFNGDGHPDLIWQDPVSGLAQIWLMGGAQGVTVTGAVNLTAGNTWRIVGTGDFNQDGHPDVVWQDPVTGAVQVWYLNGAQGNVVFGAANLAGTNSWRIASVGDFNGDGHPDVVWQDPVSGTSAAWFLGGAQGTTLIGSSALSGPNPWRIAGPR